MTVPDTCCTKAGCEAFVEKTRTGPGRLFYAFSFCGDEAPQFFAPAEGFRR